MKNIFIHQRSSIVMKNKMFLKIMLISLFVFITVFFMVNLTYAQQNSSWIEFGDIDQLAEDAQYIQWEIKAYKFYSVTIYFEDDDGDDFEVTFNTEDGNDKAYSDYFLVKIGDNYYDTNPSREMFEADLDSIINDEWDGAHSYTAGDPDAKIEKIRIAGDNLQFYSITLADNENFNNPCWQIDVSEKGWVGLDEKNFVKEGNNFSNLLGTSIIFESSYIHIFRDEYWLRGYQYPYSGFPGYLQWTNPWTAYDPYMNDILHVTFAPGSSWQSPYFQQQGGAYFGPPGYYNGGYPNSNFPSYLQWTNPWTAYDPYMNDILHVTFAPGSSWQSPYFQQQGGAYFGPPGYYCSYSPFGNMGGVYPGNFGTPWFNGSLGYPGLW